MEDSHLKSPREGFIHDSRRTPAQRQRGRTPDPPTAWRTGGGQKLTIAYGFGRCFVLHFGVRCALRTEIRPRGAFLGKAVRPRPFGDPRFTEQV